MQLKLIVLSDADVNCDFLLTHQIIEKMSKHNDKDIFGFDMYKSKWQSFDGKYDIKFFLWDINTATKFDLTRSSIFQGASGCILIFEYTSSDLLINLEKRITELVVTCGNIPIVLLGKNLNASKSKSAIAEIESLIENKRTSWGLSIEKFDMLDKGNEIEDVINTIGDQNIDRLKNPKLREIQVGTLKNLELLLINENDIVYFNKFLINLGRSKKKSASILLYNLTTSFFEQLLHNQEQLIGIPNLITNLRLIDLQFTKTLVGNLLFENLFEKIEREKDLREINLLLYEFNVFDNDLLEKFLDKISTNLLSMKIAQAWFNATVYASWTHSTAMQLVESVDSGDTQTSNFIRSVFEMEFERKKKETLFEISCLLATIFPINKTLALDLLGEIKNQIRDLAKKELKKDDEIISEKDELIKSSLEIGAYTKKEAAQSEILSGLSELDLVNIFLEKLSLDDRVKLIDQISVEKISTKINDEKNLLTILEFLQKISETDIELFKKILTSIQKLLGKKIKNESSIIIIRKLLELINKDLPQKLPEIMRELLIENWINKMILYYAEMDLDYIDISLLLTICKNYERERQFGITQLLKYRFPDLAKHDIMTLLELIFELNRIIKEDSVYDRKDLENQTMETFDFFINVMLNDILELLKIITKTMAITKSDIKEAFLSKMLIEDKKNFSYEKNRLFNFISNLPL
ncbi:MAG: hypothetical protein ACTSPM_07775 [Candidatus Heimdallarchaeota archaeon]